MNSKFKNKTLLLCCCIALAGVPNVTFAQDYAQSSYENVDYYELGMAALNNKEYNNAIDYLQKALKKDNSSATRNNLAVAYTSRGNYYYNKGIDLEKAANDYRNAIYYLQYYNKTKDSTTITGNIATAISNLDSVLVAQNAKMDAGSRLKKAKELRGKNELTASVVEYVNAAKDRQYAYESYVALGDIMKVLSNEYNAAVYYDKALAIKSTDPYLHLKFGRTLYNLGKIEPAVKELDIASEFPKTKQDALALLQAIWEKRLKQSPNSSIVQMNLGTVYQNQGKYDLAMAQYKSAQNLDPNNQTIKINIATLLQAQGDYHGALSIYNEVLKTRPDDVTLNLYKASTLDKIGRKGEAISIYKKLLTRNPENKNIKNALLNIIETMPDNTAMNYLSELTTSFPLDAEMHYYYGYTLHKNKRYDAALDEYKKSLSIDSKNLDAYLNVANIYKQLGKNNMALNTLQQAKMIYPKNAKISEMITEINEDQSYYLMEKASDLYNKRDYNDAIITYKSITNPTEDVYLGIGACYQAMERYEDAIINYNKAIALDPSNPNSHYFLGLAYFYKKDYDNAEKSLKKAKELDSINPDITDAYKSLQFAKSESVMNVGVKLFENGKNDDAIINFNKAITLCVENGYAYYYRGLAYDTKGNPQNAINDYKKAIFYNPELCMAYYSMGLSYEALNNKIEAKKMYQKFIQEYTTPDEYLKYAKQRVSQL